MLEMYSVVEFLNGKFEKDGIYQGNSGAIIEIYNDNAFEVEVSDANGITIAMVVATKEDIALLSSTTTGNAVTINTKKKILVIYENELVHGDIQRRLAQTEYALIFSPRTDKIVDTIIHEQPDIVIIDQLNTVNNNAYLEAAISNSDKIDTSVILVVPRSSQPEDYMSELSPSTMVITFPFGRLELEQFIQRALR